MLKLVASLFKQTPAATAVQPYYRVAGFGSLEELIGRNDPTGEGLKIDLGCGYAKPLGFIGLDNFVGAGAQIVDETNGPDIIMDLNTQKLPFPDNSCQEVRSSHFFEHSDLGHIFQESFRVLKPNSVLMFAVPYANSAEGMYPGHNIFLTEKFFHNNLMFQNLFAIIEERFDPTPEYTALPQSVKEAFPFDMARQFLFNACNQMTIIDRPKK